MEETKLNINSCPCCKSESWVDYLPKGTIIECQSCGLRTKTYKTFEEAVKAWNTHVPELTDEMIKQKAEKRCASLEGMYYFKDGKKEAMFIFEDACKWAREQMKGK